MEASKKLGMSEDDLAKMRPIAEQCQKEVGEEKNACELGPKSTECMKPKMKEAGLEIDF